MKSTPHGPYIIPPLVLLTAVPLSGDPAPQSQIQFTKGLQGTFNASWQGLANHTYFTQFSTNLVTWHYAPFIDFGDAHHHRGLASDSKKLFLRLKYGAFPGINSLDDAMHADFDGDGLSNIFEVTHGTNPFDPESTEDGPDASLDPDQDGLSNLAEQTLGTHPMRMDHPAVQLSVIVGN